MEVESLDIYVALSIYIPYLAPQNNDNKLDGRL